MKRLRRLGGVLALTALVVALGQELRLPASKRAWHGRVAGVIPYDFRPPSLRRARETWWNPEGPLVTGQLVGLGWSLNVGRLARLLGLA